MFWSGWHGGMSMVSGGQRGRIRFVHYLIQSTNACEQLHLTTPLKVSTASMQVDMVRDAKTFVQHLILKHSHGLQRRDTQAKVNLLCRYSSVAATALH